MSSDEDHSHTRKRKNSQNDHYFMTEMATDWSATRETHILPLTHWAPFPHFALREELQENRDASPFFRPSFESYQNLSPHQNQTYRYRSPINTELCDEVSSHLGENYHCVPTNPLSKKVYSSGDSIPQVSSTPHYSSPSSRQAHLPEIVSGIKSATDLDYIDMSSFGKPEEHSQLSSSEPSTDVFTKSDTFPHDLSQPPFSQGTHLPNDPLIPNPSFQTQKPQIPSHLSSSCIPTLSSFPTSANTQHASSTAQPSTKSIPPPIYLGKCKKNHPAIFDAIQDGDALFAKLIPLLENITKYNFEGFLVEVVKECHSLPIDTLYNLLYNDEYMDSECQVPSQSYTEADSSSLMRRGLKICQLLVETFKCTGMPAGFFKIANIQNPHIRSVNFHELLRNFLAFKILYDILDREEDPSSSDESLPRISIYKVYYIICQKLIAQYPTVSNTFSLQQNIVLGQSKLGKLTKFVFPNLLTKRLGKRGESRFHYMGFKWNEDIVDAEILGLVELDVPEIQDKFRDSRRKYAHNLNPNPPSETMQNEAKEEKEKEEKEQQAEPTSNASFSYKRPSYSFVDLECRYPSSDCSPRIWDSPPNSIPQQSKWARDTMYKSVETLKTYNIHLNPLIKNFSDGIYSDHPISGLSTTVSDAIQTLLADSSPVSAFMHLYLAILLLIFPVIIASEQEVACHLKRELQASLRDCLVKCGSEFSDSSSANKIKLGTFTSILRKMLTLNEMSLVTVRSSSPQSVLKEIVNDVFSFGKCQSDTSSDLPPIEASFLRATLLAFNAYNFDISKDEPDKSPEKVKKAILNTVHGLSSVVTTLMDRMMQAPLPAENGELGDVTQDVPHQILRLSMQTLHDVSLKKPEIVNLPIPIIHFVTIQVMNEVQNSSFLEFRNREAGLAQEVFKSWWITSTMFQEYLWVLSEVVTLSQILDTP